MAGGLIELDKPAMRNLMAIEIGLTLHIIIFILGQWRLPELARCF